MIAIVDYGCGNLFSLSASLHKLNINAVITSDKNEIRAAEKIILPGVGAFGDAAQKLRADGLDALIKEQVSGGKYLLGICLGMQLLFERSFEYGEHKGLELLGGDICPLKGDIDDKLKIPHMGWNALNVLRKDKIMSANKDGDYMYFVHSYYAKNCGDSVIATADYGTPVPAIVGCGCVYGMQFHPEKSGVDGLKLLDTFAKL